MLKAGDTAPEFPGFPENRPVLLAFFKISCPTCQFTFPYLQRMADKVPILGISQDGPESTDEFRRAFSLTFPIVLDPPRYLVSNSYVLSHVPSLFLVESDRRISLAVSGFSRQALEEIGQRFGSVPFKAGDRIPEFKPG
jgi:peroxiredoxin